MRVECVAKSEDDERKVALRVSSARLFLRLRLRRRLRDSPIMLRFAHVVLLQARSARTKPRELRVEVLARAERRVEITMSKDRTRAGL